MALSQRRARLIGRLRSRKSRVREGLVLVEGVRAVAEAVCAAELRFVLASPRLAGTEGGRALRRELADAGLEVEEVTDEELQSVADTEHPQGVLAVCAQPEAGIEVVRAGGRYVVLDAVQDPGNAGTLVRAAAAFGLDGVVALEGSVDLWGAKAVRASAGTVFRRAVVEASWIDLEARCRADGPPILVADAGGSDARGWLVPDAWALVVGNEGAGVRAEVVASAHGRLSIPMPGGTESLNAGVAGSILLYELTRGGSGDDA